MEELHQKRIFDSFNFLVNTARITPKKNVFDSINSTFYSYNSVYEPERMSGRWLFLTGRNLLKKKFSPDKLGTSQRNRSA